MAEVATWSAELVARQTAVRRGSLAVLLRLAYLGVINALSLLRLLAVSDPAKDVEILALRHQITVIQQQPDASGFGFHTG
jgi:hypothetical protein